MKNYQRLYYSHYYAQDQNGENSTVSREVCFAKGEEPTENNPYKQRWFYDPEAGYAIRLARTEECDTLGKRNAADLKAEERYRERKFACIWKGTKNCEQKCDECTRKHTSRTVEMDRPQASDNDGDMESRFDPPDETDTAAIIEKKEMHTLLLAVLDRLSPQELALWEFLKTGTKKQIIADSLGLTLGELRYREKQLRDKIRSDEALKSFFEKN
jgi:hypothetical protein